MKKVFFQAVLVGLFAFSSIAVGQYNYNQTMPRYPLNQIGVGNQNYSQNSRNVIQQPQLYGVGRQQQVPTQPNQRVFSPGANVRAQPPYVANNYPYKVQDAPKVDLPVSPSNLPIPGTQAIQGNQVDIETIGVPQVNQNPQGQVYGTPRAGQPLVRQPNQNHPTPIQPVPANQNFYSPGAIQQQSNAVHGNPIHGNPIHGNPIHGNQVYGNQVYGNPIHENTMHGYYNQGCGVYNPGCNLEGNCNQGICGGCEIAPPSRCIPNRCIPRNWFGSLGGVIFNRDFEDDHLIAYPLGLPLTNALISTDADPGAMGGVEAAFGKRFCNGTGFEVVYWGLFSEEGIGVYNTGTPQTRWTNSNLLNYNASNVWAYLNAATAYRVHRTNEFHNIELNFFRHTIASNLNTCANDPCMPNQYGTRPGFVRFQRPFQFNVLAGVRFFKFDENFLFRSSIPGDYSPHINDIFYNVDVKNSMVGLQLGGMIEYCLFPRWTLTGGTKFGIYGNSISHRQQIYGLAGYATANTGPYNTQNYDIRSTKTDVAFLGQFDLGVKYSINCNWNIGFGYRVLAVTGVALGPEQIPYDFSNYQDATYINSNSGLILHGTYLRMQYNY